MAAPMNRVAVMMCRNIPSRPAIQSQRLYLLYQWKVHSNKSHDWLRIHENVQKLFCRPLTLSLYNWVKKKENINKLPPESNKKLDNILVFNSEGVLIGKMSMSQADKMARKDSLKLLDMGINQDKDRCFKLLTGKEYFEESMKVKTQKASGKSQEEKEFRLTANISDHDLSIKLSQIRTSLTKGKQVKISVKGNRRLSETEVDKLQSAVLRNISENVQDIAIVKHANRTPGFLIFQLLPKQSEPSEQCD